MVAPTSRTSGQLVFGNTNWGTSIIGVTNEYLEARDWPLASGRLFDAGELAGSAKVAWIGATVARELFGDTTKAGIRYVKVNSSYIVDIEGASEIQSYSTYGVRGKFAVDENGNESGPTLDFSGSTGIFKTSSGANTFYGNVASSGNVTSTSGDVTIAGSTNPT